MSKFRRMPPITQGLKIRLKKMVPFLRREEGITLTEMLVAIAIAASLIGLLGTALYQFFFVTRWGNNRLSVLGDFETASLWLGRDANEAAFFSSGAGNVYGTLSWSDSSVQYRYSYDAAADALNREHLVSAVVQSTIQVARHIANQSDVSFSASGGLLTVNITATSTDGQVSESTTLLLNMRAR